ncbi:uncharacterized protein Z519_08492 [Cladophialophora bantiana CBS 173.52]|uniref:Uncharacterized protein n=1 Tax=Cladophialophora bantiana (strain ATCC 10958 / CBS 173.52 / CDC B-1940 / NIH 8579) TaxID=1442370 RepID=A0A0D2I1C8_CLAB1|nr:uncharacterized protein Z519_08492 [Cladophialophora bantiana CBS 173.52]KIW90709.1 hypothetical protein Z519_08492 [Cladophialophora bantiana CBS 173.52]
MPSAPPSPPPAPLPSLLWRLADLYSGYILPRLPESVQTLSNNITPFVTSIFSAVGDGDIVSLAAFLLTVYLTLKIADYIRRSVIGWVVLLAKIALVLMALQCVFYVNRYGWHKALSDAEWAFRILWGYVEDKVMNNTRAGDGSDINRTGWYAGGGGGGGRAGYGAARGQSPWSAYAGGARQQVPVARGRPKGRNGFGWT